MYHPSNCVHFLRRLWPVGYLQMKFYLLKYEALPYLRTTLFAWVLVTSHCLH